MDDALIGDIAGLVGGWVGLVLGWAVRRVSHPARKTGRWQQWERKLGKDKPGRLP